MARRLPLLAGIIGLLLIMIGLGIWMDLGWSESAEQLVATLPRAVGARKHAWDPQARVRPTPVHSGNLEDGTRGSRGDQAALAEERAAHAATREEVVAMTARREAETAAKEAETRLRGTTQATLEATPATLQTTHGNLTAAIGEVGQLKQQLNNPTFELERPKTQVGERGRAITPGTR